MKHRRANRFGELLLVGLREHVRFRRSRTACWDCRAPTEDQCACYRVVRAAVRNARGAVRPAVEGRICGDVTVGVSGVGGTCVATSSTPSTAAQA